MKGASSFLLWLRSRIICVVVLGIALIPLAAATPVAKANGDSGSSGSSGGQVFYGYLTDAPSGTQENLSDNFNLNKKIEDEYTELFLLGSSSPNPPFTLKDGSTLPCDTTSISPTNSIRNLMLAPLQSIDQAWDQAAIRAVDLNHEVALVHKYLQANNASQLSAVPAGTLQYFEAKGVDLSTIGSNTKIDGLSFVITDAGVKAINEFHQDVQDAASGVILYARLQRMLAYYNANNPPGCSFSGTVFPYGGINDIATNAVNNALGAGSGSLVNGSAPLTTQIIVSQVLPFPFSFLYSGTTQNNSPTIFRLSNLASKLQNDDASAGLQKGGAYQDMATFAQDLKLLFSFNFAITRSNDPVDGTDSLAQETIGPLHDDFNTTSSRLHTIAGELSANAVADTDRCGAGSTSINPLVILAKVVCAGVVILENFSLYLMYSAIKLLADVVPIPGTELTSPSSTNQTALFDTVFVSSIKGTIVNPVPFQQRLVDNTNPLWGAAVVQKAHASILGLLNIALVLLFIIIALANILQIQLGTYGIRKILPSIIIGFIAANASYFLVRAALEVTDVAAGAVLNIPHACVDTGTSSVGSTDITSSSCGQTLFDNFSQLGGLKGDHQVLVVDDIANWGNVFRVLFFSFVLLAAAVMILILSFYFLIRYFVFLFLIPLSPIAFFGAFFSPLSGAWKQWLSTAQGWLIMPIVANFWLWLAFTWVSATSQSPNPVIVLANYAFALMCFYMAMTTPFKLAGAASDVLKRYNALGKSAYQNTAGKGLKYTGNQIKKQANLSAPGRAFINIKKKWKEDEEQRAKEYKGAEEGIDIRANTQYGQAKNKQDRLTAAQTDLVQRETELEALRVAGTITSAQQSELDSTRRQLRELSKEIEKTKQVVVANEGSYKRNVTQEKKYLLRQSAREAHESGYEYHKAEAEKQFSSFDPKSLDIKDEQLRYLRNKAQKREMDAAQKAAKASADIATTGAIQKGNDVHGAATLRGRNPVVAQRLANTTRDYRSGMEDAARYLTQDFEKQVERDNQESVRRRLRTLSALDATSSDPATKGRYKGMTKDFKTQIEESLRDKELPNVPSTPTHHKLLAKRLTTDTLTSPTDPDYNDATIDLNSALNWDDDKNAQTTVSALADFLFLDKILTSSTVNNSSDVQNAAQKLFSLLGGTARPDFPELYDLKNMGTTPSKPLFDDFKKKYVNSTLSKQFGRLRRDPGRFYSKTT